MKLEIKNIGKRYHNKWLFRNLNISLQTGECLSVTGRNGSGKSTLLQIIYGLVQANEGELLLDNKLIEHNHRVFSFSSPALELPPSFNLKEIHALYLKTNKLEITWADFLEYSRFEPHQAEIPLRLFSSGMLQRVKTALCLLSLSPVLLLDEPLSNMDVQGENWYKNCISQVQDKIIIIAGNNPKEYDFATATIEISNTY